VARPLGKRKANEERSTSWRWWLFGLAVIALLVWLIPEYGFAPGSSNEVAPPPVVEPEEAPELAPEEAPEAETSSQPEAFVLRGRCLDDEALTGLGGLTIRLVSETGEVLETTTDSEGGFEFARTRAGAARIAVLAREGWTEGLSARELTPEEADATEELQLLVPLLTRAVVRGTILESRTGQPFPFAGVRLGSGDELEALRSDLEGGFVSRSEYPAGTLAVRVLDRDAEGATELTSLSIEHAPESDRAVELRVTAGPTLLLRPQGVAAAEQSLWQARIVERRGDPELSGRILRSPSGWVLAAPDDSMEERAWSDLTTREGPPLWLRYSEVEHEPEEGFAPFVQLRSPNETHVGEARLRSTVGVQSLPIQVPLREVGSLRGKISDREGAAVAGATIWLDQAERGLALGPWQTDEEGSYLLPDLDLGSYAMTVSAPLRPALVRSIELSSGINPPAELVLGERDSAYVIRGHFECRLSHGPAVVLLELESSTGRDKRRKLLRRIQSTNLATGPVRTTNEFSFTSLPGGTYTIRPLSIAGNHNWSPNQITAETPTQPLLIRCVGSAPSASMRLEAFDSESNERVPGQELYLGPAKQPPFTWPESRPAERWYTLPARTPLNWIVWAPGYRPATGALEDFAGSGKQSPVEIELERGFGMRLDFRAQEAEAPQTRGNARVLTGIEVFVDGESYGRSDENGELLLRLDARPERIELFHPRWITTRVEPNENGEERLPALCLWFEPR